MKNFLIFIITAPLFINLCFGELNYTGRGTDFLFADSIPLKKDSAGSSSCLKCHGKFLEKKFVHKPTNNECDKCHKSNGKEHPKEDVDGFELIKKVPDLCFSCHDQKSILKEQIHTPLKDGDCFSCHDVHSSKGEHLLSAPVPGVCFSCHTDLQKNVESATVKHGAITEKKACINCHSPHSSTEKKNLLKPQPDVCFDCHDKAIKAGDRVIPNMKELITKSKFVHGAIENNGCSVCHNPHGSSAKFMLNNKFPSDNYSTADKQNYALCLKCHESALFEEATTTEATGFRNGDKNLHYLHVNKEKGRTCINCHNVHASNSLFLIASKVKFGQWEMPIKYTKLPKGGTCAPGCHGEKTYTR